MSKVKSFQLIILAMIILFIMVPFIGQTSIKMDDGKGDKRPDRIMIQLEEGLSKDEMPAVGFMHDLHTQALEGDCKACHLEKDKRFIFKFKRTDEKASMDLYHNECITCHVEKKQADEIAGPISSECRSCHAQDTAMPSSWTMIKFDKSLHYVHESSPRIKGADQKDKDNCSSCHHKYNEKSKEIYYIKGEEESCSYCHKSTEKDEIRAIQNASHDACVSCHQTLKLKKIKACPVLGSGCHEQEMQKKIKTVADVPRLKRNQPDVVAITGWKKNGKIKNTYMNAVAFDHQFHESNAESCKVCHHETLKKCNDCHKADGSELQGQFISLEQAMHKQGTNRSCLGCHQETTKSTDCAGCHFIASSKKQSPESCKTCHNLNQGDLKFSEPAQVAKTALSEKDAGYTSVDKDRIPEEIKIDALSKDYKPSIFPHRKVVQSIAQRVEKSQMAKAFHTDQAGLCMGCHHNSPKTLDPPQCGSCHSKKGPSVDGRPGLKGAYHGQCITCHQKMDVKTVAATDCVKCHEEKK